MGRVAALIEVLIVFVVVHVSYRSFKRFTELGRQEAASGLNFSTGSAMILFTVALLLLFRKNFDQYGCSLKRWRYSLNVGLLCGILTVAAAALIIVFAPFPFDPRRPPDIMRALVFALGGMIALFLLLWLLMRERPLLRRIPSLVAIFVLLGLLALPLALAWYLSRPFLNALLTVLWLFLGAGFGEEMFFRGYVQSRVDQAFGRPFRFMRADFGAGLFVSALLFGFIHVLNTVDYFGGRWDFAWWWWLPNFVTGLLYGCLREKTGSILAGGVYHGLTDVLAEIPALLRH
jgi:membrane protease YdiL (CAAX protease family)